MIQLNHPVSLQGSDKIRIYPSVSGRWAKGRHGRDGGHGLRTGDGGKFQCHQAEDNQHADFGALVPCHVDL